MIENLVFSGGGVKGITFVGNLLALQDLDILKTVTRFCGTSAGSIAATLLALKFTPNEMLNILGELDFNKLFTDDEWVITQAYDFTTKWGLCPGKDMMDLLAKLVEEKTGNPDTTFSELYELTGNDLVIVATNQSYARAEYLCKHNTPELPIRIAVRMSVSIPFIFEPYYHLENKCYYVDGGIVENYALTAFDGEYPGDTKAILNQCKPNPKTLGMFLLTNQETLDFQLIPKQEFTTFYEYAASFINTFMVNNDRRHLLPGFFSRTIVSFVPDYPLTTFQLTPAQKQELVEIGKSSAFKYFQN